MPTAPAPRGFDLRRHPVVIGVLPAAPVLSPGDAIAQALALVSAGADVVDVCPVESAPTADADLRWSPAQLVAGLVESGIPTLATVRDPAHVHLAMGSGAVALRDVDHATSPEVSAVLAASGVPVIVAEAPHPLPAGWYVEAPLAEVIAPDGRAAVPTDVEPHRTPASAVAPAATVADIDAAAASDPVSVAAQVTVALEVGVRVFRTPVPRTVRRVAHVVSAIEAAG